MRKIFLLVWLVSALGVKGNDGAFYAAGNQLIPITETQVSVSKEVLTIERVEDDYLKIRVQYVFFNPGEAKEILVGFEAASPSGDVDGRPKHGQHPYIYDFKVMMNDEQLEYQSSIVNRSDYVIGNKIEEISTSQALGKNFDENYPNFFYVYHFNSFFLKGINTIQHEYKFKLSGSVELAYYFEYILTAANRWANGQIDDFTLVIDLGNYVDFNISKAFFTDFSAWSGASKLLEGRKLPYLPDVPASMRVITAGEPMIFKKKNFRPEGELIVYQPVSYQTFQLREFDYTQIQLPFNFDEISHVYDSKDEDSYKILRNLPFARRGYVFKTALIQQYYENLDWYKANPRYKADMNALKEEEQIWLQKLRKK